MGRIHMVRQIIKYSAKLNDGIFYLKTFIVDVTTITGNNCKIFPSKKCNSKLLKNRKQHEYVEVVRREHAISLDVSNIIYCRKIYCVIV